MHQNESIATSNRYKLRKILGSQRWNEANENTAQNVQAKPRT